MTPPLTTIPTAELETRVRIAGHLVFIWSAIVAHPGRYSTPAAGEAAVRVRQHRQTIVELTSELDRRRDRAA